jgi:hypothetical protein
MALCSFTPIHAQNKIVTLSGKVISFEESLGLEGVAITVKGTKKNSGTQSDGTYTILVSPEDKILVFTLEGYETEELSIPSKKGYDVTLKRNNNLSETNVLPKQSDGITLNLVHQFIF